MMRCARIRDLNRAGARRASAAVAMIIVLVILQLAVVAAIAGGGGGGAAANDLTRSRLDAVRAFYAAEAGMNMSLREIMLATDADDDGAVGGISDDADDSTDPDLGGGARVHVARAAAGADIVLTSRSRSGAARRAIRTTLE